MCVCVCLRGGERGSSRLVHFYYNSQTHTHTNIHTSLWSGVQGFPFRSCGGVDSCQCLAAFRNRLRHDWERTHTVTSSNSCLDRLFFLLNQGACTEKGEERERCRKKAGGRQTNGTRCGGPMEYGLNTHTHSDLSITVSNYVLSSGDTCLPAPEGFPPHTHTHTHTDVESVNLCLELWTTAETFSRKFTIEGGHANIQLCTHTHTHTHTHTVHAYTQCSFFILICLVAGTT